MTTMTEDIWAEKPDNCGVIGAQGLSCGYEVSEMDAWLDKVHRYIGNLETDIAELEAKLEDEKKVCRIVEEELRKVSDVLESVEEYVLMESENIVEDMEHKGMLKQALEHFRPGES